MYEKLLNYVCNVVPKLLEARAPETCGKIAEMVFEKEISDDSFANQSELLVPRDRAALAIPYQVQENNLEKREHVLNVVECAILIHRKNSHGENHEKRIEYLKNIEQYTHDEMEIMESDFWN